MQCKFTNPVLFVSVSPNDVNILWKNVLISKNKTISLLHNFSKQCKQAINNSEIKLIIKSYILDSDNRARITNKERRLKNERKKDECITICLYSLLGLNKFIIREDEIVPLSAGSTILRVGLWKYSYQEGEVG
jgi:hypothetical protein